MPDRLLHPCLGLASKSWIIQNAVFPWSMLGITIMQNNSASTSDLLSQGKKVFYVVSPTPKWRGHNLSKAIPSLLSIWHYILCYCFYCSHWLGFNVTCGVLSYGPETRLLDDELVSSGFKIQLYHWSPFLFNLSTSRKSVAIFLQFPCCFHRWLNCPTFPWNSPLTTGTGLEDTFGRLWEG